MKFKMFSRSIRNLNLKSKILIYVLVVIIACMSVFYFFFNRKTEEVIINNSLFQTEKTVYQTCEHLQYRLYSIQMQFNAMETDQRLLEIANKSNPTAEEKEYINKLIEMTCDRNQDYIHNIFLCDKNNRLYYESVKMLNDNMPVTERSWYKIAMSNIGKTVWKTDLNDDTFMNISGINKLHLIKAIRNRSNDVAGVLVFELNEGAIRNFIGNIEMEKNDRVLLIDGEENVISNCGEYDEDDLKIVKGKINENRGFIEDGGRVITYNTIKINGWKLVYIMSRSVLAGQAGSIRIFTIYLCVIVFLIALVITKIMTTFVTRPVYKLIGLMQEVKKGNFNVRFNSKTGDEIGVMGNVFDDMCSKITTLIDEVIRERELKNYSELKTLQEQIKAHFLYNTLDTVYWMAKSGDSESTAEMVSSLATLFRLALNDGKELTTIKNEIEYVEKYIYIEKIRKGRGYVFEINLEDGISDCTVPKMILQPLVENAIAHGVYDNKQGKISIGGYEDGEYIVFTVSDDGGRLDIALIDEILSRDAFDKNNKGYALLNLKKRLEIIYNRDDMIKYTCIPNEITTFTLRLPKKPPKNNDGGEKDEGI